MIVAIATCGDEIAWRVDGSSSLLLIEDDRQTVCPVEEEHSARGRFRILEEILARKADVLLCGGIRRCDQYYLEQAGIRVIFNLRGNALARLNDFQKGKLSTPRQGMKPRQGRGFSHRRRKGDRSCQDSTEADRWAKGPGQAEDSVAAGPNRRRNRSKKRR